MATRRRDIIPGREKKPATTGTTMASPSPRLTPKTPASSTPIHPKIGSTAASPDVSRQPRRPAGRTTMAAMPLERKSPSTPQRTTTTTTLQRPANVSTLPSPRPSMPSKKSAPSQKPAPEREKSAKALVNDAGKPRPAVSRSGPPAAKKVGGNAKKQGVENSAAAMKGHVNRATPDQKKVEHKKEPEVKTPSQDFFLSENEELTFRALEGAHEMGADDSLPASLETYSIEQFEADNYEEPDIVVAEPPLIAEHKEASVGVEKEEMEDKEESIEQHRSEKIESNEINNNNSDETAAYDTKSMAEEAVIKEEETWSGKNETAAGATSGSMAAEVNENKGREAVEEKKQDLDDAAAKQEVKENKQESEEASPGQETTEEKEESDNASPENAVEEKKEGSENTAPENAVKEKKEESDTATPEHVVEEKKQELDNVAPAHVVEEKKQKQDNTVAKLTFQAEKPDPAFAAPKLRPVQGKAGSAVSNEVIEETVVKLSERKNKVRALAGAFETVIALQDNKR